MTYPPPATPAAGGTDRSALLGWIGVPVGFLCCAIAGIVLGVLSIVQAGKYGSSKTPGIAALVASVAGIILNIVLFSTGAVGGN